MAAGRLNRSSLILWIVFFGFSAVAIARTGPGALTDFAGGVGAARAVLLLVWIAFLGYSIECSRRENIFRTIGTMSKLYWSRQIGIDLYISVFLSIGLAWLVTGSVAETLFWAAAFIPFANLAILLFVILHLDRIAAMASMLS